MRSLRKHLSYANVVATFALLFAMGGSAVAANHYLIHSTKQIAPKVLKKLKGPAGRRGHGATERKRTSGDSGEPGPGRQTGRSGRGRPACQCESRDSVRAGHAWKPPVPAFT